MAKKKSNIKPLFPQLNVEEMTRKTLQSLKDGKDIHKFDYTDLDIETPFGVLKMRECELTDSHYGDSLPLFFDYSSIDDAIDAKDWIKAAVLLENAIEKYPQAPLLYIRLEEAYQSLKKFDKAHDVANKNYSFNKGLPLVDIKYMTLGNEKNTEDYNFFYNTQLYNIQDAYPQQDHFHPLEIVDFYCHLGESALNNKNIPLAEKCSEIMQKVDPLNPKSIFLKISIYGRKNPNAVRLRLAGIIIVALGVIALIGWGIYRLFAWIF